MAEITVHTHGNLIAEQYKTKSIRAISNELNIGIYQVRKILKAMGVKIRDKSESMELAIKEGRAKSPNAPGSTRSEEVKNKIAESVLNVWEKKSDEELQELSKSRKEAWAKKPESEKKEFFSKALAGVREASVNGSKLERYFVEALESQGFKVSVHGKFLKNENLEADIFLPEHGIVIEVDGPSHVLPIWGEEKFQSTVKSDNEKNGLVVSHGMCIIRVQHTIKTPRKRDYINMCQQLIETVNKIVDNKPEKIEDRLIYIKG